MLHMLRYGVILVACLLAISPVLAKAATPERKLQVVTSFSILADMTRVIGAEHVDVYSLVGPEEDVHVYQPRPKDAQRLAEADLLVLNGLGFEGWIERLIEASGYQGPVVTASDNIPLLLSSNQNHNHGSEADGHDDPHAWQSIANAKVYVNNIAHGLARADETHNQYYFSRRDSYQRELDTLDQYITLQLSKIPENRRKLLTLHRAYSYFESAYDIEFVGARGINASAGVSARDLASLIRLIKAENIAAAFFERSSNPSLLRQLTRETGSHIVGNLYADSLSKPAGPASTYITMMRYNANSLFKALSQY